MRYGVCIGDNCDNIRIVAECGFDFVETRFSLFSDKENEKYELFSENLKKYNIPCYSVNNFLPADIKTTGNDVDIEKIKNYIENGMKKASAIGVKTVVFGSGKSRNVPDGFCFGKAVNQLVDLLENVINPIAVKYGMTVVIEPLCDSNIINTVKEGAMLATLSESSNIRSLADYFHMGRMNDSVDNIKQCEGLIRHSHIANPVTRDYPKIGDGVDYKKFVDALKQSGCETCAIEGGTEDFVNDAKIAIGILKAL